MSNNTDPAGKKNISIIFAVVVGVALLGLVFFFNGKTSSDGNNKNNVLGKVAMSEDLLKATVKAQNLKVYWGGPIAGDKYALLKTSTGINLYYLNTSSLKTSERIISTYPLKNAFIVTEANGKLTNGVGFTNIDGNAVYYSKATTTSTKHVYVGMKNAAYQVEIFDPRVDQALALGLKQGGITLVQ